MTVLDIYKLLSGSDILLIVKDAEKEIEQKVLYKGYKGLLQADDLPDGIMEAEAKRFRALTDIRNKKYRGKNLIPSIDPYKKPDCEFEDMQITIYYKIII